MRARDEVAGPVARIAEDRRHHQPLFAARRGKAIEVFRQGGLVAVGHAVLSDPPAAQVRRRDLQIATATPGSGANRAAARDAAAAASPLPLTARKSLKRALARR